MRRDMWKIIEDVKIDTPYQMTQEELQAIFDKANRTHEIFTAFIDVFSYGFALGQRQQAAAYKKNKKGRSC